MEKMTEEIEKELNTLIIRLSGYRKPINTYTSVNLDIRIDGDDAYELLETVQNRFGTRFETLDWHAYFHNEGDCSWPARFKLFGYKDTRKSLTFGKLIEVVQQGEWFEN